MNENNLQEIVENLTPRRKEVLQMVLGGESDDAIAQVLSIKPATVRKYLERLYQAFGVNKRVELVTLFAKNQPDLICGVPVLQESVIETRRLPQQDLGEAPDTANFYGRVRELEVLKQWIGGDNCRAIAIVGMGGLGKTTLSVKLVESLQEDFDFIIWRSLRETPKLDKILTDWIKFFSDQQEVEVKGDINERISLLIDYLRSSRCLLVLDNFESILNSDGHVGSYQEEFQEYSLLVKRICELSHQSCLVLTSRVKPEDIAVREGENLPVRILPILGLRESEALNVLKDKGLIGNSREMVELATIYSGNPLALKIVSTFIKDLFNGKISEFIYQGLAPFVGIESLLESQFNNLSSLEKEIMCWLAINREPVNLKQLFDVVVEKPLFSQLVTSLENLKVRSLIETVNGSKFTLQNVVMEYIIGLLIRQVSEEIQTGEYRVLRRYSLIQATAKDYIRNCQINLILKPIAKNITVYEIDKKLVQPLQQKRENFVDRDYAIGNIINLLLYFKYDLSGLDFSNLTIWQAYLRGANLHNVKFTNSDLDKCRFSEAFGTALSLAYSSKKSIWAMGDTKSHIRLRYPEGQQWLTMEGHTNWVRSIAFSCDGKILASASDDKKVMLWDTEYGRLVKTLKGHKNRVWSVAISPNGKTIASGSEDKTIRLWQADTGECFQILEKHTHWVRTVAFSPDGNILASGSSDKNIIFWNGLTGEYLNTLQGHTARVRSIAFSPDGKTLASGSDDCTIILWDVQSGKKIRTLSGHRGWVRSVAFHSQGDILASGSEDFTVILWNINTGQRQAILGEHIARVWSVTFCGEDGQTLISSSDDKTVKFWRVESGECIRTFQGNTNWSWSIAFNYDGDILASGNEDKSIKIWDIETGEVRLNLSEHNNRIRSIAISPNNDIIASGSDDKTIKIWDIKSGQILKTFADHPDRVLAIAFSPDGQKLVSAGDDKVVRIWDICTGEFYKTQERHQSWVWSVAFSPNGKILASGSEDETIKIWDVNTGICLRTIKGHTDWVRSVKFHPKGKILASGSEDKTVKLWDIETGECVQTMKVSTGWVRSIAFSPNGQFLAVSGGSAVVEIWDIIETKSPKLYKSLHFPGHCDRIWSVAFSADGKTLASSSEDGSISIWNADTGQLVKLLRAPRIYENMDITGVINLTKAQVHTLKTLGAVKNE
ncbi:MAG: LuxR family transcriptional regulator [Calothrix sp. CSU_2_0]|nr:LuxR family transcriptional regulator [Calothrix sp. CSU_2_0]